MEKEWVKKQQELLKGDFSNDVKPKRTYLHFDYRIRHLSEENIKYVLDKNAVRTHPFYPFILRVSKKRRRNKSDGKIGFEIKERPICFAAHLDSLIYSWYAHQLNIKYEEKLKESGFSKSVVAYRSGIGSTIDHACHAFRDIQEIGEAHVACFDISSFFNNLNHSLLKKSWSYLIDSGNSLPDDQYAVYKAITKFSTVSYEEVYKALDINPKSSSQSKINRLCAPLEFRKKIANKKIIQKNETGRGIPQGSTMSALLANMYMFGFDARVSKQIRNWNGAYYRYSDDILIIVPKSVSISDIENFIQKEVEVIKLSISSHKTEAFTFGYEKGIYVSRNAKTGRKKDLSYLGLSYDGHRVLFKHASLAGYQRRVVAIVRREYRKSFRRNAKLAKRKIYERYTRFGRRNYYHYVLRCAKGLREHGFDSAHIKRQGTDFFVHKMIKELKSVVLSQIERRRARRAARRAT